MHPAHLLTGSQGLKAFYVWEAFLGPSLRFDFWVPWDLNECLWGLCYKRVDSVVFYILCFLCRDRHTNSWTLLGDGTVFTRNGKMHICEMTAEPGIQGCLIARQKTYKNIWQRHLQVSLRNGETSNERAQKLHGLFSIQCTFAPEIRFLLFPVVAVFENMQETKFRASSMRRHFNNVKTSTAQWIARLLLGSKHGGFFCLRSRVGLYCFWHFSNSRSALGRTSFHLFIFQL